MRFLSYTSSSSKLNDLKKVVTHTHHLRTGELNFSDTNEQLVDWCSSNTVSALGLGSPWEPISAKNYSLYEGEGKDLYYSGDFDCQSVKDEEPIQALFDELNHRSCGHTLFYMDNETPKCRYGHIWWFGWNYDFPAWHDYSQNSPISYYDEDPEVEINSISGLPHKRRAYMEVVASQRAQGALAIWAHPTSWWRGDKDEFITNIAAECHLHLLADGYLDGLVVMGYDAYHEFYQKLWFYLLDTGAIVPGFAETDNCHNSKKLLTQKHVLVNKMHISCKPQLGEILNAARVGQVCATTNAGIMIDVDGVQMGSICQTSEKKSHILTCTIECFDGEEKIGLFEIISKHGEVLFAFENCEAGTYEFQLNGISDPSYILARTFGENDSPYTMNQQDVKNHAISNPVYLHPEGFKFQQVTTSLELQFEEGSPWLDGALEIQNSKGKTLVSYAEITSNMHIKHNVPASAKVVLTKVDQEKSFWISMENLKVQELLAYIWQGKFLEDYPSYSYGEVPPEAFDIHKMRQALQNFKRIL